jgi:general secretion pathway protein N
MKKTITLSLVFVVSFIVFCVAKLPAAIALDLTKSYFPKNMKLGTVIGTVWEGQLMQLQYDNEQLNNVRWNINAWQLLSGNVDANVKFGDARDRSDISGYGRVTFNLFDQQITVNKAIVRSSVERALEHVQLPLPTTAKGRVILTLNEYVSGAPYCDVLNGDISSPNIDVQGLNGWFNIGALTGDLDCKSGDIAIAIDPENKLGLEADATLSANFNFKVSGYVKPDASLPKDVHDAVKYIGIPDGNGRYPLNF